MYCVCLKLQETIGNLACGIAEDVHLSVVNPRIMRHLLACLFTCTIIAVSCKTERKGPLAEETPEALQEKPASSELSFKKGRYHADLVESLYKEVEEKTPSLHELRSAIYTVARQKRDSIFLFEKFDSKNREYYTSAGEHINKIKDSVLHQRIKILLGKSQEQYNAAISSNRQWIDILEKRVATLHDLFIILKLSKTIPVIEKYQAGNQPPPGSLAAVASEYDKTILQTDKLSKD